MKYTGWVSPASFQTRIAPSSGVVRSASTYSTPSMMSLIARAAVMTRAPPARKLDCRAAKTLGATADEDALAGELGGIYLDAHTVVSSVLMAPCTSVKR